MMVVRGGVRNRWQRGFSLVEILVVVALLGLVLVVGIPNFRRSRIRAGLISQMKQVRQAAAVARINAIKGGQQTVLTTTTWLGEPAVTAWVDENANGGLDANERVLGRWMFHDDVTVTADATLGIVNGSTRGVIFLPNGMSNVTGTVGGGLGHFFVADKMGNSFRVTIYGGAGTVEERMKDFTPSGYQPEPFRYWRY